MICAFLGANWHALVASMGLAALFIIHICYALWLTVQNRKARGADRYQVNGSQPQVEWSSKNMLVLGIVVLAFLAVHLIQFWAKMQLAEIIHCEYVHDGVAVPPAAGSLFLHIAFSQIWTPIVYIIGFVALWFHMNHGFWSMFHTIGWDNNIWLNRLKSIACWWTSIVVLLFTAQAILFTVQANNKFFLTDEALQQQYAEYWGEKAETLIEDYQSEIGAMMADSDNMLGQQQAQINFFSERGDYYAEQATAIKEYAAKQAPAVSLPALQQLGQFEQFIKGNVERAKQLKQTQNDNNE